MLSLIARACVDKSPPPLAASDAPEETQRELLVVVGFSENHIGGVIVTFADGSVRIVSTQMERELLQRLGHRADDDILDVKKF